MRPLEFLRSSVRINNNKCAPKYQVLLPSCSTPSAPPPPRKLGRKPGAKCGGDLNDAFCFERRRTIHASHSFLHSGPISKTLSYFRSKMDMALSSTTLYPTHEEVRQWERCFESLLQNKFGCALFRQFLKKEFSDENVDFWLECEEFKKMKDGKKATAQKAMEIYRQFVAEHAPKEVNLDCDTRAATKAALENGCRSDTFTLAQNRVEQLMSKDSYRRFLRDRIFLDLLESYEEKEQASSSKEK